MPRRRSVLPCLLLLWFALVQPAHSADRLEPLADAVQFAAGEFHSCAVTAAGAAVCWGSNQYGQLGSADASDAQRETAVAVAGLASDVRSVAAGQSHACALKTDGSVRCWGRNNQGQLGDGSLLDRAQPVTVGGLGGAVVALALGEEHSCALLASGQVRCWGRNDAGQLGDGGTAGRTTPAPIAQPAGSATVLAAGAFHTCAVVAGSTYCWGRNDGGQLGDGSTANRSTPTPVSGLAAGAVALAAGRSHSCALAANGGVSCWGSNAEGQLGDGSFNARRTPVAVAGLGSGVRRIAASLNHSCAIAGNGGVLCWGDNFFGQLGDGSDSDRNQPVAVRGAASGQSELAAGYRHACAGSTDRLLARCWGNNFSGQLGNGEFSNRLLPRPVTGLDAGVTSVGTGFQHSCAFAGPRGTFCWGDGSSGQLGQGASQSALVPVAVAQLGDGSGGLVGGQFHSCSLTASGGMKCWGRNSAGQLGDGTTTSRNSATAVSGLQGSIRQAAAGAFHTCALSSGGQLSCWGSNASGQLGNGEVGNQSSPTAVVGLPAPVQMVAAGQAHTCALTTAGAVFCWGANGSGQLGDGTTGNRRTPVAVTALGSGVVAISVNGDFSCALLGTGAVRCWGSNTYGQLGDGSTTNRTTPNGVAGLPAAVRSLSAAWYHVCAVLVDRSLVCWGRNTEGQVGDNSTRQRLRPVAVAGLASGVAASAGGGGQNCVLRESGAVQCWGANNYGQVGDGSSWGVREAVVVQVDEQLSRIEALTPGAAAASSAAAMDGSGRYVVFQSRAALVAGDGNGATDIYRRDARTGTLARVSLDTRGREIAGDSIEPALSADGQRLVFVAADAAVAEVHGESPKRRAARLKNTGYSVFLRDLLTGTTHRVGGARPQGTGTRPDIDPAGTAVVWTQPNADAGQGAVGQDNVYLGRITVQAGGAPAVAAPQCVTCKAFDANGRPTSVNANGSSSAGAVSRDGTWVAWQTAATNTKQGEKSISCPGAGSRIILRNLLTGSTREASTPAGGSCGGSNQSASQPRLDAAGGQLVFQSDQPLIASDTNAVSDIYLFDGGSGALRRLGSPAGSESKLPSSQADISDDGRVVAFTTGAGGLDPRFPDNNDARDVHVLSTAAAASEAPIRLSRSASGGEAGGESERPVLSGDGSSVAFESKAANLNLLAAGGLTGIVQRRNPVVASLRSGIWWNAAEPGWGLFVFDQGDVLGVAWYTYDIDGEPTWFLLPARPESEGVYVGDILRFTGVPFDRIGNSAIATTSTLGTATLRFASGRLDFEYSAGTTRQRKVLTRFPFGTQAMECRPHASASRAGLQDYSDVWAGSASGWGLFIVQIDATLFPAWYTFDGDGEAVFLVGQASRRSDGSFAGPLYRQANGTPFAQINGAPASPTANEVGTGTFRFSDGDNGVFEYALGAVRQSKPISRLRFGTTASACSTVPVD